MNHPNLHGQYRPPRKSRPAPAGRAPTVREIVLLCGRCEQIRERYPDISPKAIISKLLGADVNRDEAGGAASTAVTGEQGGKMLACFLVHTEMADDPPSFLTDGRHARTPPRTHVHMAGGPLSTEGRCGRVRRASDVSCGDGSRVWSSHSRGSSIRDSCFRSV